MTKARLPSKAPTQLPPQDERLQGFIHGAPSVVLPQPSPAPVVEPATAPRKAGKETIYFSGDTAAVLEAVLDRMLTNRVNANKSHAMRAGLHVLAAADDEAFRAALKATADR